MQHKAQRVEFKVDEDKRQVSGYASTFGNRDTYGDVVRKGAFAKTIDERLGDILVLAQHEGLPVGKPVEMKEDRKGLHVVSEIAPTPRGDEVLQLVKFGALKGLSIGFNPVRVEFGKVKGEPVRFLDEVKLWEYSFVSFPANEKAQVTSVKSLAGLSVLAPRLVKELTEQGELTADELEYARLSLKALDDAASQLREAVVVPTPDEEVSNDEMIYQFGAALQAATDDTGLASVLAAKFHEMYTLLPSLDEPLDATQDDESKDSEPAPADSTPEDEPIAAAGLLLADIATYCKEHSANGN